jgi:hypothetical protein
MEAVVVVGEEVMGPEDCDDIEDSVVELCDDTVLEPMFEALLLFFDDALAPTPPPTAAATITTMMIARKIQNVFAATQHIRLSVGAAGVS